MLNFKVYFEHVNDLCTIIWSHFIFISVYNIMKLYVAIKFYFKYQAFVKKYIVNTFILYKILLHDLKQ